MYQYVCMYLYMYVCRYLVHLLPKHIGLEQVACHGSPSTLCPDAFIVDVWAQGSCGCCVTWLFCMLYMYVCGRLGTCMPASWLDTHHSRVMSWDPVLGEFLIMWVVTVVIATWKGAAAVAWLTGAVYVQADTNQMVCACMTLAGAYTSSYSITHNGNCCKCV